MAPGDTNTARDKGVITPGPPKGVVLVVAERLLWGHVTSPQHQTMLLGRVEGRDQSKKAKILWDGGSFETLIRSDFFPDSGFFPSKHPKIFAMADSKTELPGGTEQAEVKVTLGGLGHDWRPVTLHLQPYRVQMEWDMIVGHKDQHLHCLAHYPRWNCLALHTPYPNLWVEGWRRQCAKGLR